MNQGSERFVSYLLVIICIFLHYAIAPLCVNADQAIDEFDRATGLKDRGYTHLGFFNGGGGKLYTVMDGRVAMSWQRGPNNTGDVFLPGPTDFQALASPGDVVQADVRVNINGADIGDEGGGLYRSGPGIYLASTPHTIAGNSEQYSIMYFIGNQNNDMTEAGCVMTQTHLGSYVEGRQLSSLPGIWSIGQWVKLKVVYVGTREAGSQHVYRFEYDAGQDYQTLGEVVSPVKLAYAGFQFHTSLFDNDVSDVKFPVNNYMELDNFLPAPGPDAARLIAANSVTTPAAQGHWSQDQEPNVTRYQQTELNAFWASIPSLESQPKNVTLAGPDQELLPIIHIGSGQTIGFAATELRHYVEQMTGMRPRIIDNLANVAGPKVMLISAEAVGEIVDSEIPEGLLPPAGTDEFRILTVGDSLVIAGGSDRAVLYGVYDLLERLGCRWFGPLEEHVPEIETLVVPAMDVSESPGLRLRVLEFIAGSDPACVDWMTKLKLNGAWPEKYTPNHDMTVNTALMESTAVGEMKRRGLTIFWGGHVLPYLFPLERYKEHPEYFALIDGKRLDLELDLQTRTQLCTSNPEVMRILSENTVEFLHNHPWIDILILWGNDTNHWCECEPCRKLEPQPDRESDFGGLDRSASYCRLIKIVSEAVERELPGQRIGFNHYYNLEDLPRDAEGRVVDSVLPARHVLSSVDAFRQCDRHAFTDPSCPKGKRVKPIADMWAPYYDDSVSWSYYWSWNFMKGLPISMVHKIPDDFRYIRSLGINGVVDNVSLLPSSLGHYDKRPDIIVTDHWRYNVQNFYIYGKAAWNPDLDVDSVSDDFIDTYYGPAAKPMKQFWSLMEESWTQFGRSSRYMPDDDTLLDENRIHGWVQNIRDVIPNKQIFKELTDNLEEARFLAASAYDQPLKAQYMPYLERVQLLERALSLWPSTETQDKYGHD